MYRLVVDKPESDRAITVTGGRTDVTRLNSARSAPTLPPMHTLRLIYASTAASTLSYDDLVALLRHSAQHNDASDITGLLVYGNGLFLQALEGERTSVNRLYHRIAADSRHADCTLLLVESIEERAFAEWTMKLVGLDDLPTARRRALLLRHAGRQRFDPYRLTPGQAIGFLRDLAEAERLAERIAERAA